MAAATTSAWMQFDTQLSFWLSSTSSRQKISREELTSFSDADPFTRLRSREEAGSRLIPIAAPSRSSVELFQTRRRKQQWMRCAKRANVSARNDPSCPLRLD